MRPVILIPGIGGSILVNRHRPTRRILGKEMLHNRWLNVYPFLPNSIDEWKQDMGCSVLLNDMGKIAGVKSVNADIDVADVGGTKGIKDVLPEFLLLPQKGRDYFQDLFQFRYFHDVCEVLYAHGYADHHTLFGIPYDFRMVLDPAYRAKLFHKFKENVEKSVATNRGQRCVVFTHSLGSVLFKWFISSFVSHQWIADHIEHLIVVSPPFGGSVASLKTVLFGDFYIPNFHKLYMNELQVNTGIIMCLPNTVGFDDDAELITCGGTSITLKDYAKREHVSMNIWKDLYESHLHESILKPVSLPTTIFYCASIPTPVWYGSEKKDAYPYEQRCADGDGIISELPCGVYMQLFGDSVKVQKVDAKHTHIICHQDVIAKLLECALTDRKVFKNIVATDNHTH